RIPELALRTSVSAWRIRNVRVARVVGVPRYTLVITLNRVNLTISQLAVILGMSSGGNAYRRKATLRATLAVGGGLVLCAVAFLFAGRLLVVSRPLSDPDAIVSLASHEWERLPMTARLAVEHPNALVLITLPKFVTTYSCHDCDQRIERLVAGGVEADRIRVLSLTRDRTDGEAAACHGFFRQS